MLEQFADWHRDAGIEPNPETFPKHQNAIEQYQPKASEVISLARAFYGFIAHDDTSLSGFASALRTADPTLATRHIEQLMTVFAGAMLVSVLNRQNDLELSDLSALSLLSGAAQGLRTALPISALPSIAARYIERRAGDRTSEATTEIDDSNARIAALQRELTIVSEEVSMLWWMVSGFSRDRNTSWEALGPLATPLMAGKELADLTRVIPGPVAAAAFIDRVVSDKVPEPSKATKVKEAIDATPRDWRERCAPRQSNHGLEDLTPFSNALRLSLLIADGEDWSSVFEKGTKLSAKAKLRRRELGYQMFLERILAKHAKTVLEAE